jgi:hypothetical protein
MSHRLVMDVESMTANAVSEEVNQSVDGDENGSIVEPSDVINDMVCF